jgi:hypothetical protein
VRAPFGQDPGNPDSTTPGVRINDVNSWSEFRVSDLITQSLALRYDFYELIRQHLIASVDLLNVLNLRTATDLATAETGYPRTFGQVTARQPPLQLQLGLRYTF